jgi:hypothetical protein
MVAPLAALTLLALSVQSSGPAGDSTYESAHLRRVIARAAEVHARPPDDLAYFRSSIESEISLIIHESSGGEVPVQVEQYSGRVDWWRQGRLAQSVTGYRARFVGLAISSLSYLRAPWVIAPLYGDRVPITFGSQRAGSDHKHPDAAQSRGGVNSLVHPFAVDREEFYRFTGGDTVMVLRLPTRTVPVVRVWIEPTRIPRGFLVFRGEIYLDSVRDQIVRMRGQVFGRSRRSSAVTRLLNAASDAEYFLDLENAEWGGTWLPYRQRVEVEVEPIVSDESAVLRIVTAFSDTETYAHEPGDTSGDDRVHRSRPSRVLRIVASDSLAAFLDWKRQLGTATKTLNTRDFDDIASAASRFRATPRLTWGTGSLSEALRYNRVEGLFTGFGVRLGRRGTGTIPGAFIGLRGGFAWTESTMRGVIEAGLRRRAWEIGASVRRELASTNDFPRAFSAGSTILGVVGLDDFDYVDRYAAEGRIAIHGKRQYTLEARGGAVWDRPPSRRLDRPPFGGSFRDLRPVEEGSYAHLVLKASMGGLSGGEFLSPGFSAAVRWGLARGELDWQRLEGLIRARRQRDRWSLSGEMYAGLLLADRPPPQSLFELGSPPGRLLGFGYKAFSGDRAAVGAIRIMYSPPVLEAPFSLGRVLLPGVSPSPAVEVSAGWTGASGGTTVLMERLGWASTGRVRMTLFVGLGVFGGALRLGVARPVGEPGRWRFEWRVGAGA